MVSQESRLSRWFLVLNILKSFICVLLVFYFDAPERAALDYR